MIYILRLILFIISYIGLVKVVNDKLKLKKEFSLALTTAILILVLLLMMLFKIPICITAR